MPESKLVAFARDDSMSPSQVLSTYYALTFQRSPRPPAHAVQPLLTHNTLTLTEAYILTTAPLSVMLSEGGGGGGGGVTHSSLYTL